MCNIMCVLHVLEGLVRSRRSRTYLWRVMRSSRRAAERRRGGGGEEQPWDWRPFLSSRKRRYLLFVCHMLSL
jgi:hypothetical protein